MRRQRRRRIDLRAYVVQIFADGQDAIKLAAREGRAFEGHYVQMEAVTKFADEHSDTEIIWRRVPIVKLSGQISFPRMGGGASWVCFRKISGTPDTMFSAFVRRELTTMALAGKGLAKCLKCNAQPSLNPSISVER